MRVLSIDPGYDRCGVAVLEHGTSKEKLIYSDCITTDRKASFEDRLFAIGEAVTDILTNHKPDSVAIERLYFNTNQKTAMGVSEVRGMITYLAKAYGCALFEYTPQQIKIAVTGHGGSSKDQVTDMVGKLIRLEEKKRLDDEYDAIAVGITCLAHEQ